MPGRTTAHPFQKVMNPVPEMTGARGLDKRGKQGDPRLPNSKEIGTFDGLQIMLFPASVQPSIISLFSSTGSDPLSLFRTSVDKLLPSDSFLHFLHDQYSSPPPPPPGSLLHLPKISEQQQDNSSSGHGYELDQTVLHIQSPTIQTTYIQCPKAAESRADDALGVRHPWMHLQVRNLGREWAFEVGIVDHAGRVGIVRLSTFQVKPFFFFPLSKSSSFHLQRGA